MLSCLSPEQLESGLEYSAFRASVTRNGDALDDAWQETVATEADLETLRRLPPLTIVALAEDWCPDAFQTLPTWARLAEELPGWSCRIFSREDAPALMEAFLYQGRSQRIPVYAFLDHRGYLQAWWSGRCRQAQEALDHHLAGRAYDQMSSAEKKELTEFLNAGYRESFRRLNFLEMLTLLRAFFHVA